LFTPYEEFDYDDSLAGSDKNGHFSGWSEQDDNDEDNEDDDDCVTLRLDNVDAVAAGVVTADESYPSPAIMATNKLKLGILHL
jgi:hypothetical protein